MLPEQSTLQHAEKCLSFLLPSTRVAIFHSLALLPEIIWVALSPRMDLDLILAHNLGLQAGNLSVGITGNILKGGDGVSREWLHRTGMAVFSGPRPDPMCDPIIKTKTPKIESHSYPHSV